MGIFRSIFLFVLLLATNSLYSKDIIPDAPQPVRYVNDLAAIFTSSQVEELESYLKNYKDSTSTQITVVTVESLEGMDASMYAAKLGDKWGVGQADKDNGIVFLVAPHDRKYYIATGKGLQDRITDLFLIRLKERVIIPEFKRGNFYSGVLSGVMQITDKLSGAYQAETDEIDAELSTTQIILLILFFFLIIWGISKVAKAVNYGETYSGRGYHSGFGGGFWGGGGSWGGDSSWGSGGGGDSWGGGSFDGGGAGGDW